MTTKWRFTLFVTALAMATASLSCGSSPTRPGEGERSDIPMEGPEPGPLEEQVRQYLIDMTDLLMTENDDPQVTVESVGGYLHDNGDHIRQSVRELSQRIVDMNVADRVYYEERFSTYFEPTTRQWMAALDEFRRNYPQHATLIDGLMIYFD